jgi:hypothetical protein
MSGKQIFLNGLLALSIANLLLLTGCGDPSTPPAEIFASVSINPAPPVSIPPGGEVSIGATVTGGSSGVGVGWSCLPADVCGTFSPGSTSSGAPTTYTAPSVSPPGGLVTIVASYVSDSTRNASVNTVITGQASNQTLTGQYALFLTSPTGSRGTTSVGGSIILDGNGNVEGGVVDIISPGVLDLEDPILPTSANPPPNTSAYAVDALGRGTLTVRTAQGQTLGFSIALTSPSHALLAEIDGNPGSGTLDLQQQPSGSFSASQIAGAYSFTMTGTAQTNPATKVSYGGMFTTDGVATLTNGLLDSNTAGVMSSSSFGGTFSGPDSNGRGMMQLSAGKTFIYYIISAKALRLFEADDANLMGGSAYPQGGSGIFVANECVYQNSGWSADGLTIAAGEFNVPEGDTPISGGISDANMGGTPAFFKKGIPVTGSWGGNEPTLTLVDAAGNSTFNLYVVDLSIDILDPNNSGPNFNPGAAGNALMLHTDGNINGTGFLFERVGQAVPRFQAGHAIQLRNSTITNSAADEVDLVGVVSADGSASFVSGLADYDRDGSSSSVAVLNASVTGDFAPDSGFVRHYTGSITIPTPTSAGAYPFIPSSAATFSVSYYQISATETFVLQTDSSANSSGFLFFQMLP